MTQRHPARTGQSRHSTRALRQPPFFWQLAGFFFLFCGLVDAQLVQNLQNFPLRRQLNALKATVRIKGYGTRGSVSTGTGTLVGLDNTSIWILTASHVVHKGVKEVHVFWYDGRFSTKNPTPKKVVAQHVSGDVALVRLFTTDKMPGYIPICPVGKEPKGWGFGGTAFGADSMRYGFSRILCLSVGCDHGRNPSVNTFWVLGQTYKRTNYSTDYFTVTSREPAPGRSGGPLVSGDGYLVGVCVAGGGGEGVFATLKSIRRLCDVAGVSSLYGGKMRAVIPSRKPGGC